MTSAPIPCLLLLGLLSGAIPSQSPEVRAFLERADALIADRNYDYAATPGYQVHTDDPRLRVAEAASLLESFRDYFESWSSDFPQRHPVDAPARFYLFYSRFKYKQLLEDSGGGMADVFIGQYRPSHDTVAIHTDTAGLSELPDLLVHEAAHHLVTRRLYGVKSGPSPWISEGLAGYFGFTLRDGSGKFVAGRIGGKGVTLSKEGARGAQSLGSRELARFRRTLKDEGPPPLADLLRRGSESFYDPSGLEDRYAASWLLVHFLLHGEDGALRSAFVRLVAADAEGERDPTLFLRALERTTEELEAGLLEHVRRLKAR